MPGLIATRTAIAEDDPLPPGHDRLVRAVTLGELYSEEKGNLLRFLRKRSDQDIAEDILHQLFIRLANRNLSDVNAPRAYLFQAARNLLRDHARDAKRQGVSHLVPIDDVELAGGDPIALLETRDHLRRLESAMNSLKPFTREIFLACRIDGYSYREIADRTGLSVRGVEKQMSRAIKQLGRHLQRHE